MNQPTAKQIDIIVELLQLAQAYDSRNIDAAMRDVWLDAARRQRWLPSAAAEAIRAHYAESTDRIMPGHVTARLKALRPSHTPAAEVLALAGPGGSTAEHRGRLRAEFAARQEASRAARGVESRPRVRARTPNPEPVACPVDEDAGLRMVEALLGRRRPDSPSKAFG